MSQQSLLSSIERSDKAGAFELRPGNLQQFGATLNDEGCNFAIYAPDAEEVFICLFDKDEQVLAQVALQERSQSKWFGIITNVTHDHLYGIRLRPKKNRRIHPDSGISKLLIDPYAKSLNRPLQWQPSLYQGDSHALVPKAHIVEASNTQLEPLEIKPEQRIIYETHIKGLTAIHPEVPDSLKGKYLGACHPAVISHLKALGVSSVQFLPLMSFMPEPFITEKGLTNYWGYNPINFFAAEPRYAVVDAMSECKEMIQSYRDANIEVILDVVFNHTCESGHDGPVLSFRGLCESHAYLMDYNDESDTPQYVNYSGCGNTLKVSDSHIMNLLIDALRYWVSEMGVSGFRFDLASIVGREVYEFKSNATFFRILKQDPVLKNAMMLAEPWDIGPGGYQLGQYPDYWLEVNDKFRDVVRGFWRGDKGLKGEFATRMLGSRDVFRKNIRPMHASVNNVTYHDGFTLHDTVCYEQKHNEANLEENRDGHNHNLSGNYGVEGPTTDAHILDIREQQKRNLFATLILSQGTPHILGGDELSRTQNGNNNAYCQDNSINWYDWNLDLPKKAFLEFCSYVIALRNNNPLLQQMNFADDLYDNKQNVKNANWYRRDGSHKSDIDWVNHEHHCFALHVVGELISDDSIESQEWLFCINSLDKERDFNLPILQNDGQWQCQLDTAQTDVKNCTEMAIEPFFSMQARSMRIYKKTKI
ncbi:MAG: glycogen operon protein [Alphaproteobacteria bacterium]|jgi:glycogen operon protein